MTRIHSSTIALVMAGGRGVRMKASGVTTPKPLTPVLGIPLLECNVRILLHWGLREIAVSVSQDEVGMSIKQFCERDLARLVSLSGGSLRVLVEPRPLGNLGSAGMLANVADEVLTVFADNVTSLNLQLLLRAHGANKCALTLAAHEHLVRIPYGQVVTDGDNLVGYVEKPSISVTVASGVAVLGREALTILARGEPAGLVDLATELVGCGLAVDVFRHAEDWVDVNAADGIPLAEEILTKHHSLLG